MNLPDSRILLTGGTGFLGTHVRAALEKQGCIITDIEHAGKPPGPGVFIPRSAQHDLTRPTTCKNLLEHLRPNLVIHLAALTGGIGANRARPAEFYYHNITMGTNLLHYSYQTGVEKFVGVGTICSYPKHTPVPFTETDIWQGYPEETNAAYGLAKKMLLVQAQAYRQQYGFNAIHVMPTNLYGPGDNFDPDNSHVIPALIRKFITARDTNLPDVTIWGTGRATREFLYVEDAATAILAAATKYDKPEPLNIGTGHETSIKDLVDSIARITGYQGDIVWDKTKPDGQPRRSLDVAAMKLNLNFSPSICLEAGLYRTIDWYVTHLHQKR